MSRVDVLKDASATLAAVLDLLAWAEELHFAYAWMSADDRRGSPWHSFPFSKVVQGVVGLQFAGTDVEVLEKLLDEIPDRVKVMYETRGTFHPKVVVGIRGSDARAIIGSANFTKAAFSANYEVNLLVDGNASDRVIADLLDVIDGYYRSPKSRGLDAGLVEAYRKAWTRRPKPPRLPLLPRRGRRTGLVETWDDLDVDWDGYFDLILAQDDREFLNVEGGIRVIPTAADDNAYLTELRRCRDAFAEHGSLAAMPVGQRQVVAGFGDSLGWFGRMGGAGYYKQQINSTPAAVSAALDEIPEQGQVEGDSFLRVTEKALGVRGVGLGCWTRLLSMKRPDLFLSVNSANKARLRSLLGAAPGTPSSYWKLTQTILALPWASSPPPDDEDEREIWEGRAALLDAVLYEPAGDE